MTTMDIFNTPKKRIIQEYMNDSGDLLWQEMNRYELEDSIFGSENYN